MQDRLTGKQEAFCLNIVKGMTQYDAYLAAGYAGGEDRSVVDQNASHLADDTKILSRINELRASVAREYAIMPVGERKERLSELAKEDISSWKGTPIRGGNLTAIDLLNKMDNLYVEKHAILGDIRIRLVEDEKKEIDVQGQGKAEGSQ